MPPVCFTVLIMLSVVLFLMGAWVKFTLIQKQYEIELVDELLDFDRQRSKAKDIRGQN